MGPSPPKKVSSLGLCVCTPLPAAALPGSFILFYHTWPPTRPRKSFESSALTLNLGCKGTSWSEDDFDPRWIPEHKRGQTAPDHWRPLQSIMATPDQSPNLHLYVFGIWLAFYREVNCHSGTKAGQGFTSRLSCRSWALDSRYLMPKVGRNRDAGFQHPASQLQDPGQRRTGGAVQGPEVGKPTSVSLTGVHYSQSPAGSLACAKGEAAFW